MRLRAAVVRPLDEPLREDEDFLRADEPLRDEDARDADEPPLREEDARDDVPLRDEDEPLLRDEDEPLLRDEDVLRERDDVLRLRVERLPAGLRSFAGTSSRTTAPASVLS